MNQSVMGRQQASAVPFGNAAAEDLAVPHDGLAIAKRQIATTFGLHGWRVRRVRLKDADQ